MAQAGDLALGVERSVVDFFVLDAAAGLGDVEVDVDLGGDVRTCGHHVLDLELVHFPRIDIGEEVCDACGTGLLFEPRDAGLLRVVVAPLFPARVGRDAAQDRRHVALAEGGVDRLDDLHVSRGGGFALQFRWAGRADRAGLRRRCESE